MFYDNPPFANGLPHYGSLLTGYVKDVVPRFKTMRGKRVERRFGWDCHGLPAEVEAKRLLGIASKAEIVAMGIKKFNGSPIPVWRSDDPDYPRLDVYGSLDDLERDFGIRPDDLHRPGIDQLTRANPDDPSGKSTMRRVPEVLDCWFESGRCRSRRCIDTTVTPELTAEGAARDVIRTVQQARRDARLAVTDRITLTVGAEGPVADAVRANAGFIAGETLAVRLHIRPPAEVDAPAQPVGDGGRVKVKVAATKPIPADLEE